MTTYKYNIKRIMLTHTTVAEQYRRMHIVYRYWYNSESRFSGHGLLIKKSRDVKFIIKILCLHVTNCAVYYKGVEGKK